MGNCLVRRILGTLLPMVLLLAAPAVHANIVTNGDFESGDQDFLTDYSLNIGANAQRYNVTTDPRLHHRSSRSYGDHTSGSGHMMAVNGATAPDQMVWGQYVSLAQNTDYEFSIWVSSWIAGSPAELVFDLGGLSLGSVSAPVETGVWDEYYYTFNSGGLSGSVLLSITDLTRAYGGNDFAIDDIVLSPVPLPASIWLLMSGFAFALRFRQKRVS